MKTLLALASCALMVSQARGEMVPPADFVTHDDLEVTVWATTPQFFNPTNIDIDRDGRIWVTEAVNYRNWNNNLDIERAEGDRVVVLTDSDGDGRADKSHTFVQEKELVAPLGISVIDNKIVVACSPNLIVYTDVDRNQKFDPTIDKREILLTGFGGYDHDHSLHSVTVGPDGYWYFNAGNDGAHTVTDKSGWTLRAGSNYGGKNTAGRKSDDGRVWVGGLALRMRPDGTGMRPIGHNFRNSYEQCVTSLGDVFQNDNDDPPACRTTWLMEYGNAGFASFDGRRSWHQDRRPGQSTAIAEWRQEDPGTLPAGDVYGGGAPCGIVFVENSCLDELYPDGLLLSCESALSKVFGYVPKPEGAGFELERFDWLKSIGKRAQWFRPCDVAVGPDGAIYVADWYDPGVGGHKMADKTASGTIYRIAPKGFAPTIPKFDESTIEGAIAALESPAVNVRAIGFETLRARGESALPAVEKWLASDNNWFAMRAIWLLPYLGQAGVERCEALLAHDSAAWRIAAIRSLARSGGPSEVRRGHPIMNYADRLAIDKSPAVRREVATMLRDAPWSESREVIVKLADGYDGHDRWYLEALGTACEGKESEAYDAIVGNADPLTWDDRLAGIAWRLHPPQAVDALATRAGNESLSPDERLRMQVALAFIPTREAAEAMLALAIDGPADTSSMAAWWGHNRHDSSWREFDMVKLFPALTTDKPAAEPIIKYVPPGKPIYESGVLTENQSAEVDIDISGATRLYLVVDDGGNGYAHDWAAWVEPTLVQAGKPKPLTELNWHSAYTEWGEVRKDCDVEGGKLRVHGHGTDGNVVNGIGTHANSVIVYDLSSQPSESFVATVAPVADHAGSIRFRVYVDRTPIVTDDAAKEVEAIAAAVAELKSDARRGEHLFFSNTLQCGRCHKMARRGGEIGPDLTSIASKHAAKVLVESIVAPNAAISLGFDTKTVIGVDGKVTSGFVVAAGDPLILKDADGKTHRFAADAIDEVIPSKKSLMPDMNKQLTTQEVADLVGYLRSVAEANSQTNTAN